MRRTPLLLVTAVAVIGSPVGAQNARPAAAPAAATRAAALPAISLPAPLGRVLRDYERAWQRGDNTALAALFADDGFVLQNGRAPVRGRAAIAAAYAGQGGGPLRLQALAASVSDTLGFIVGTYHYDSMPSEQGKFTLTLRRRPGGAWLIASDMDNSSRPPR